MKRTYCFFITIFLCLGIVSLRAQTEEVNNFKLTDGVVSWVKVYNFEAKDSTNVKAWFRNKFRINEEVENTLYGSVERGFLPFREVGYNKFNVIVTYTYPCNLSFMVSFKEGRYRMVVTNIEWIIETSLRGTSTGPEAHTLYQKSIVDGHFSPRFRQTNSEQLDKMLSYYFTYKGPVASIDDDW